MKWWQWPLWGAVIIACAFTFNLLAPGLGIEDPDPSMVELASSTQVPLFLYLGVGIAREVTGSLWVPVWMHALNNGLATLTMLGM